MSDSSAIRDGIFLGELRVYYMGEQDQTLEKKMIESYESAGYKFNSMAHTRLGVRRLLFIKDEFV